MRNLMIIGAFVFLLTTCSSPGVKPAFKMPANIISAPQIASEYYADSNQAKRKYTGKQINIIGVIDWVGPFIHETDSVRDISFLTNQDKYHYSVTCDFPKDFDLSSYRENQIVVVTGTVAPIEPIFEPGFLTNKMYLYDITLTGCTVLQSIDTGSLLYDSLFKSNLLIESIPSKEFNNQ